MNRNTIKLADRESWTVEERAALRGYSRSFAYKMLAAGKGPELLRIERTARITRKADREWEERMRKQPDSAAAEVQ
ncbi:hypothetical protein QWY84_11925 [Aquisalimonas lutea]|uniref:hypothetical protein n=1 Tax=Aquisalimonas lutea TaxID=1327750 RepID=UPI0025B42CE1|nr:hypothetical protein [Aquisalimonas lutea]MDN3518322.1 hypothetical protein [Aquisalimonas lutea]